MPGHGAGDPLGGRSLALLHGANGDTAQLAALGAASAGPGTWAMAVVGLIAQAVAVALLCWGHRWPERALHALIATGTGLIATVTALSPDDHTAVLAAAIGPFLGVIASFFPDRRVAAHVLVAVTSSCAALALDGLPVATIAGLQSVVLALVAVTRTVVLRAATASIDPLTGLANRRSFDETLTHLTSTPGTLSAALLDLDHCTQVNDVHGHHAGDALLQLVASRWAAALPPAAVLARHGGDEFALQLPGVAAPQARTLVRDLCALGPHVGVSAGIANTTPTTPAPCSCAAVHDRAQLRPVAHHVRGPLRTHGWTGAHAGCGPVGLRTVSERRSRWPFLTLAGWSRWRRLTATGGCADGWVWTAWMR